MALATLTYMRAFSLPDHVQIFWGLGPESFKYSRSKIQQVILDQMEKNNWVGVCCEPNVVFVVCNQFPVSKDRLFWACDRDV